VCTLDRSEHLRRTLEGLARQTYGAFEVVVVNGPSSDGTAELLTAYPVRVGRCAERHTGLSRNVGARMAAGDVVAMIDDDAVPEPEWLERLADAYADPHVAAAGGPVFDVPLGRVEWALCTSTRDGEANTKSDPPPERYLGEGADPFLYLAGCNLSIRASALRRVDGFNAALPYVYDDVEVCMRVVDLGARIAWVEDVLVHHHRAPSAVRDAQQVITDPYTVLFSRAVFATQSSPTDASDVLTNWVAAWCDGPAELVPEERRAWFRERAALGLADGVRVGRQGRPTVGFGRPPRRAFRPYL
jgi:GT2 family glycosyltransferase